MKKNKKENAYQKQLEEGIKNLKAELEAKSTIFREVKEKAEEIEKLKIELEAKTEIFKNQRETLNEERKLHKELQNGYDSLSSQNYINLQKIKELQSIDQKLKKQFQDTQTQLEAKIEHLQQQLTQSEQETKEAQNIKNDYESEITILKAKIEQQKDYHQESNQLAQHLTDRDEELKKEREKRQNLEEQMKNLKVQREQEQTIFQRTLLEEKSKIADIVVRLQQDYPNKEILEESRQIISKAGEIERNSREQAEQVILDAEKQVQEMKNRAQKELELLLLEGRDKIKRLSEKLEIYTEQLKSITYLMEDASQN